MNTEKVGKMKKCTTYLKSGNSFTNGLNKIVMTSNSRRDNTELMPLVSL